MVDPLQPSGPTPVRGRPPARVDLISGETYPLQVKTAQCCRMTTKSEGTKQCTYPSLPGYDKCYFHLLRGTGPQRMMRDMSLRRIRWRAEKAMEMYGVPVPVEVSDALNEELARTNGHIIWLMQTLAKSDPETLGRALYNSWPDPTNNKPNHHNEDAMEDGKTMADGFVKVWFELYQGERKHLINVARTLMGGDISAFMARLSQSQGVLLGDAVAQILMGLELTPDQQRQAMELVPTVLQKVLVEGEVLYSEDAEPDPKALTRD